MRVLLVFAHPSRESFCGAILAAVLQELSAKGHQVELLDLYQEEFNPVLSKLDWQSYEASAHPAVQPYADQIRRSDGLIWIFPTWNYGMPAILKGYVDRVWKPNIAFRLDQTGTAHFDSFENLKFFIAVTTYGAGWFVNTLVGNPCKRVIARCLRRHFSSSSRFAWLALYGMDKPSPRRLKQFLEKVQSTVRIRT
jgi:putative NADPH-quinone reductase